MTSSSIELEQIAKSQTRQQILLIILCLVLAASTVITWRSVRVMREANEIQRQLLTQQADVPPKSPQKRRASVRAANNTSTESHRSRSVRSGAEASSSQQKMADSTAPTDLTNTHAMMVRTGRQ
jgi:hypothetical protein